MALREFQKVNGVETSSKVLLVFHRGWGRGLEYFGEGLDAFIDAHEGEVGISDFHHGDGPITDGVYVWEGEVGEDDTLSGTLRDLTDEELESFTEDGAITELWIGHHEDLMTGVGCKVCEKFRGEHYLVVVDDIATWFCDDLKETTDPILYAYVEASRDGKTWTNDDIKLLSSRKNGGAWIKNQAKGLPTIEKLVEAGDLVGAAVALAKYLNAEEVKN